MQGNQHELGANAYLFLSTERYSRTIVILAHGGRQPDTQFTVPAGCTIHYHAQPNQAYTMVDGPLQDYVNSTAGGAAAFTRGPNSLGLDLKLGKVLGKHWEHWDNQYQGDRAYRGLVEKMVQVHRSRSGSLRPHVVVIRNRSKVLLHTTPYVWLSEIVSRILRCSLLRGPFDIHVRACLTNDEEIRKLRAGKQKFQAPPNPVI